MASPSILPHSLVRDDLRELWDKGSARPCRREYSGKSTGFMSEEKDWCQYVLALEPRQVLFTSLPSVLL